MEVAAGEVDVGVGGIVVEVTVGEMEETVAVGATVVGVDGTGVLVGWIAVGLAVGCDIVDCVPLLNWIAPISNAGPRGLAKKSFAIPISAAFPAAGDELEGRKLSGVYPGALANLGSPD